MTNNDLSSSIKLDGKKDKLDFNGRAKLSSMNNLQLTLKGKVVFQLCLDSDDM